MKGLSRVLALAVALVTIAATAQAQSYNASVQGSNKVIVAGTGLANILPDSVNSFTIPICPAGASGAMATSDTLSAVQISGLPFVFSPAPGSDVVSNIIRITVWGAASGVSADTLKCFLDYGNSPWGPWLNASPTTYTNLIVAGGAGAADTVGSAYFRQNRTPLTSLANGGLTAWSGYATIKSDATSPSNPLFWPYARLRLAGDCTASQWVWTYGPVEVAAPFATPPKLNR